MALSTFIIKSGTINTLNKSQVNYLIQNGFRAQSNGDFTKQAPLRAYYVLTIIAYLKQNNIPYQATNPIGQKSYTKKSGCGSC